MPSTLLRPGRRAAAKPDGRASHLPRVDGGGDGGSFFFWGDTVLLSMTKIVNNFFMFFLERGGTSLYLICVINIAIVSLPHLGSPWAWSAFYVNFAVAVSFSFSSSSAVICAFVGYRAQDASDYRFQLHLS